MAICDRKAAHRTSGPTNGACDTCQNSLSELRPTGVVQERNITSQTNLRPRSPLAAAFTHVSGVKWRKAANTTHRIGCLPAGSIIVRDMFTHKLASGRAGEIMLDFSLGALYLEGSQQMAGVARAEQTTHIQPEHIALNAGGIGHIELTAPPGAQIVLEPQPGLPISVQIMQQSGETSVSFMAPDKARRAAGHLRHLEDHLWCVVDYIGPNSDELNLDTAQRPVSYTLGAAATTAGNCRIY